MTTPALRALKETFPQSKLALLTSSHGAHIVPYIPFIEQTFVYDAPWVKNKSKKRFLHIVNKIKKESFDCAIIFTNFSQNPLPAALLTFLANIPEKIGYCRENPYELLTTWIPDNEPLFRIKHGVERQLDLVASIGATTQNTHLYLSIDNESKKSLARKLSKTKIDVKKPLIIIHPGASEKKRQFSIDFFAEVSKRLLEKEYEVVTTGTKEEKQLLTYIDRYTLHQTTLLSNLSLGELIALIDRGNALISNNTGPVHIAAAMQTPVVVLYAATNPEHTPWKVAHKIFYFSVDKTLHSKNQVLTYMPPFPIEHFEVSHVIEAVESLLSKTSYRRYEQNNLFV